MSKILIGGYGLVNYLYQRNRRNEIQSQYLMNTQTNEYIYPKKEISISSHNEFITEDKKGTIGIVTPGKYIFFGIGKSNQKCLISTDEEKVLIYSKDEYDIKVINKNIRKIKLKSEKNLYLTICYNNYPINEISNLISNYFKNDKIVEILNKSDNLDENWNDILSISLKNSALNNDFSNPKIEIITSNQKKDISEISNKYNFYIILNNFKNANKNIIDDPLLISIISQDYNNFELTANNLLIWVMQYVEQFTIYTGKFFKYYQEINENFRDNFIRFIVAHKIASLYLKVDSEKEIDVINMLNEILNSEDNSFSILKESILYFGLLKDGDNYYDYSNYYCYYY